jgi:hypothetical protein
MVIGGSEQTEWIEMTRRTQVPESLSPRAAAITEAQKKYICDLLDKKDLLASPKFFDRVNAMDADEFAAAIKHMKEEQVPFLTKNMASSWIEKLKSLPNATRTAEQKPLNRTRVEYVTMPVDGNVGQRRIGYIITEDGDKILAGSYGLPTADDERFTNDTSFFKVWVGDRGGWDVSMYVSDDTRRVDLSFETKLDVLWAIAQAPEAAASLFGHEFKRCGICGRGLTNDESRDRGIGPVCASRIGTL